MVRNSTFDYLIYSEISTFDVSSKMGSQILRFMLNFLLLGKHGLMLHALGCIFTHQIF